MYKPKTIIVTGASQGVADAQVYPTEARSKTGELLHVDSGARVGKWCA